MRKAILLYNPVSGRRPERRAAEIESAKEALHEAGVEAVASPTHSSVDTTEQARHAVATGYDTVFACGGDGTVHDVVQALAGTKVQLGIIPAGTANALAHDLGLPLAPAAAARWALSAKPRRVALGHVTYQDLAGRPASRYFTVTLGVGMDAKLFLELSRRQKAHFGMAAYYVTATRLWLTTRMCRFRACFSSSEARSQQTDLSQLLAVRICNFGGVLRELAPGASLAREDLRLVLFRTRNRLAYLAYVVRGLVGARWNVPGIDLVYGVEVQCEPSDDAPVYLEADGEILGRIPAAITLVPGALTILAS